MNDLAKAIDGVFSSSNNAIAGVMGRTQLIGQGLMALFVLLEVLVFIVALILGKKAVSGVLTDESWQERLLIFAFWYGTFLVFPLVVPVFKQVLGWIGLIAGGGHISDTLPGPGAIAAMGLKSVKPLWEGMFGSGASVTTVILNCASLIIVIGAFVQLLITYILNSLSMSVVMSLGLVFIPMGVFGGTRQFGMYYIQCVVGYGLRFVVTVFMVEATIGIFEDSLRSLDTRKVEDACAVVVLTIAYNVAINVVPNTAKDLISGGVTSYRLKQLLSNIAVDSLSGAVAAKIATVGRR